MTTEAEIQAHIMLAIGSQPGTRIFRNNTGQGWQGEVVQKTPHSIILAHPRPISFGLHLGSPDLVGWRTVTIEPRHVGRRLAVFAGLEVKTLKGRASDAQRRFLAAMASAGALGGEVRNVTDAERLLAFT